MLPPSRCSVLGKKTTRCEGLGAALRGNSELPHCCREGCNFTFTECKESSRDVFQQENPIWMGRTVESSTACWSHVTLSSGTSAVISCPSVNGRIHASSSNNFVVFFLQKHELRIEEESAFFWQVANRPLNCEYVECSKQTPSLPRASEGDDCIQVFLSLTRGAWSTHGRQFDVRK